MSVYRKYITFTDCMHKCNGEKCEFAHRGLKAGMRAGLSGKITWNTCNHPKLERPGRISKMRRCPLDHQSPSKQMQEIVDYAVKELSPLKVTLPEAIELLKKDLNHETHKN